jgi:hypothetical protein
MHIYYPEQEEGLNSTPASALAAEATTVSAPKRGSRLSCPRWMAGDGPCIIGLSTRLQHDPRGSRQAIIAPWAALVAMLDLDNDSGQPLIEDCSDSSYRLAKTMVAGCVAHSPFKTDGQCESSKSLISTQVGDRDSGLRVSTGAHLIGFIAAPTIRCTAVWGKSNLPARSRESSPTVRSREASQHCLYRTSRAFQAKFPDRSSVRARPMWDCAIWRPRRPTVIVIPASTPTSRTALSRSVTRNSTAVIPSLPSSSDQSNHGVAQ